MILSSMSYGQQPCGFDEGFQPIYQTNPSYFQEMENELQQMISKMKKEAQQMTTVTIPVVFHVIHQGETIGTGGNINNSQIAASLSSLNADFLPHNIQFCLAQRDPEGNAMTELGVKRVNGAASGYNGTLSMGGNESDLKGLSYFSNFRYLNIWVVSHILNGTSGTGQVLGFATFPNSTADALDGIVMDKDFMGISNYHVLTHEVGHFLNLYHTFHGDDPDFNPATPLICPPIEDDKGDKCADTQAHKRSGSSTCPSGNNPCYSSGAIPNLADVSKNHMDYSSEICRNHFSEDQVERMQACLMSSRLGLTNSLGCLPSCNPFWAVDFSILNSGAIFINTLVTFNGSVPSNGNYTYEWLINGKSFPFNNNSSFLYSFPSAGEFDVCFIANDGNCKNEKCKKVQVFSSEACTSNQIDECENILNGDFSQYKIESTFQELNGNHCGFCTQYVCNWGVHSASPFFCKDQQIFGLWANNLTGEAIRTVNSLNLTPGEEYKVSFDYSLVSDLTNEVIQGEIEYGLTDEFLTEFPTDFLEKFNENSSGSGKNNDCTNFGNFKNREFFFEYNENMGDYFYIKNKKSQTSNALILFVKNLSISECCNPNPQITETKISNCTYKFDFDKGEDEGTMYWTIEGGHSGASNTFTQTFAQAGTYEVCLYVTCDGKTVEKCIRVNATDCEAACGGIISPIASAIKFCGQNSYQVITNIPIPAGFQPCGENLFIQPSTGINYSNYNFNTSGTTNILSISMNTSSIAGNYSVVLCGEGGQTLCVQFGGSQNATECNTCEEITIPVIATCNDTNLSDLNFSYGGSFSITPGTGFTPCGATSTTAGYSQGSSSNSGGTYTFPFNINTNNPNPFNSEVTVCFYNQGADIKKCYKLKINVINPCQLTTCIEIENTTEIKCNKVENGVAFFNNIGHLLFLPEVFKEGYTLCPGDVGINHGIVTLNGHNLSVLENGYVTNTSLEVPCEDIETTELTLNFCKGDDEFCVTLKFNLVCDDCPGNIIEGRSSGKNSGGYLIYPNPSKDILYIDSKDNTERQRYKLYDVYNRMILSDVLQKGVNSISTSRLSSGIYSIELISDGNSQFQKILIID